VPPGSYLALSHNGVGRNGVQALKEG